MAMVSIASSPHPPRHRFTAEEFEQMCRAGILPLRGIELLAGEVIDMKSGPLVTRIYPAGAPPRHRFTTDEYREIAALGLLPDGGVELLNGEVIDKMTQGENHSWCTTCLNRIFSLSVGERAVVRVQAPLQLDGLSLPEPDICLVRPPLHRYRHRHPMAGDVLLLIEVAESSLLTDRNDKLRLYARNSVPEYWIANIVEQQIEVYRLPDGDTYQDRTVIALGQKASCLVLPDILVTTDELFLP